MNTLLFPDTGDIRRRLYPSLLFCVPLHVLQIAEVDTSASENDTRLFFDHDLCRTLIPAPFGGKLERFLQIRQAIATYTEQSATGDPAAVQDGKNREFSSLLQKSAIELATDKYGAEVRKAQLTLALSEMLDRQEEILLDQLYFLDQDELAALSNFKGENGNALNDMVDNLQAIATRLATPDLQSIARRVAAWQRLLGEQSLPEIKLWLVSTREAAEEVFSRYRAGDGSGAVPLLSLSLPAYFRESTPYIIKHIEEFREATIDIHRGLVADFDRVATEAAYQRGSNDFLLPYDTDWAGRWETMLDEFFPTSSYGRAGITFYLLPKQPVAGLLDPAGRGTTGVYIHGLLGVLEKNSSDQ